MSASSLSIGRLRSHFRSPVALDEHALHQWHGALAETDASSLVDQLVGPDEWLLIRQLDLSVSWQPESARIDVGQRWSRALEQAIEAAANSPGHPDVVRYVSRRHGLADLLYRSALGESQRQWAWLRMGWIDRLGQLPDKVLHQGLSHLLSQPEWIWPMLHGWVGAEAHTGALNALLNAVPDSWWSLLFMRSPGSAPYAQTLSPSNHAMGHGTPDHRAASPHAYASPTPGLDLDPTHLSGLAQDLWRWLRQRPAMAERHAAVLSVLLSSMAWPGRGVAPGLARQRVAWAREVVRQAALMRQPLRREPVQDLHEAVDASSSLVQDAIRPDTTRPHTLEGGHDAPSPQPEPNDALPAAPDLPEAATWLSTAWAGALFWLRLALQPGVLGQAPVLASSSLADDLPDTTGHALLALSVALGVPDGDPAQLAMVGGQWPEGHPDAATDQALQAQAGQQVQRWSQWLAEQAPDLPEPRVQTVCQRAGRLRLEPGWIELHLPLDQVDTRIRRLGLDIDPGHLMALGCVLRICYD